MRRRGSGGTLSGVTQSTQATPDRSARFLDDYAPGLTWLAATILEWAELPPFARRVWSVTVSTTRAGEVSALAAIHAESGLCVATALPDAPPPFLGEAQQIRRLLAAPEAIQAIFDGVPMLAVRRLPGFKREVLLFDGEPAPPRHALLRRARADEWQALELFRQESDVDPDPATLPELAGPTQRGLVWVLEGKDGVLGFFRIEGVSRRRVQFADACVHPRHRGHGYGTALLRSAAHVARTEYARGAVLASWLNEAGRRTAARAGFAHSGTLEDVLLA